METDHFFIVGAQRAGTTYLYHILDQHPEIAMARPIRPEPKFFLSQEEFAKGKKYYLQTFFLPDEKTRIYGEKSTSYLETLESALRIKEMFPRAKIIITLRNPVFRAVSNYFFSFRNGLETRSLKDALTSEVRYNKEYSTSVSPYDYLKRGHYVSFLKTYYKLFDPENIRILIFTRFAGNPSAVASLFGFLDVDRKFIPERLSEKINTNDLVYDIEPEVLKYLNSYFKSHIRELEEFLEISLDEWKVQE